MPYAVPYARFSSKRQAKGNSLERQQNLINSWLNQNPEYQIYSKTFQDLGKSGFKGDHLKSPDGFGQLLYAIEQKEIKSGDVILVEAIDRLGRLDELEMFSILHDIIKSGVSIVTLSDNARYGPELQKDQLWILTGKFQQARDYSIDLSRRIKSSHSAKEKLAREGKTPKRRTPIWLNSDGSIKPSTANAIKDAFDDALSGMGERRILRRLIEKDPSFLGKNPSTVRKWLTNKIAIGYWKGFRVYPPIVSDEKFYQLQKKFESEYKPAAAPSKHFISGLVKCGSCGSNLQVKANKGSPFSMVCSKRSKFGKEGCDNGKSFPMPVLLPIINDTATRSVETALSRIQLSQKEKETVVIEGEISELNQSINNLTTALIKFPLTPEIENQLETLIKDRKDRQDRLNYLAGLPNETCTSYEAAWDEQYKLIQSDPMRLNALLQLSNFSIKCHPDMTIESSNTDNELSKCKYTGYDRKAHAYKLDLGDRTYRITARDSKFTKERLDNFIHILEQQRKGLITFQPLEEDNFTRELYEFYATTY
ncbi:recombinase family protein [Metapseudomonas otitidis]|uniref:recombinase family protein n=1 Tax=Metapseudomonas otitidis TaxID=319939 RepID=UPI000D19DC06|nr:recombinase family protein [Pseudomonas otitidis]